MVHRNLAHRISIHLERDLRLLFHQWQEIPSLDDEQFAIRDGDDVRGSRPAVEQSNLPEYVAFADQVEHRIMAIGGWDGYFHGSLADHKQAGAGIALGADAGPAQNRFPHNAGGEAIDLLRAEFAEKVMSLQQRTLVGVAKRGWSILKAGHGPTIADTLAE